VMGLDIAATYIPCFDVGGDLYDFFQISDSRIVVIIADVIGKGIPAAIMMSMFRGTVRAYAVGENGNKTIEEIVGKLNWVACRECENGEFISLFYAIIDVKEKTITYCNCGHEPTVLIREGQILELERGGLVLGVEAEARYETESLELKDGDCLLFYTDGLIDAANFEGEFWGRGKMLEAARRFRNDSAELLIKDILTYRRRFVGLVRQIDDTSVIVVKVKGEESGAKE